MRWLTLCGSTESEIQIIGPFESMEDARADVELSSCEMAHQHLPVPKRAPRMQAPSTTPQERRHHVARCAAARNAQ